MRSANGVERRRRYWMCMVLAVLAVFTAACSNTVTVRQRSPSFTAAPPPAPSCLSRPAGAGMMNVDSGPLRVYMPHSARVNTRLAAMLLLHGTGGSGEQQLKDSKLTATAERYGFIIAAPNGGVRYKKGYAWNVPNVPLLGGKTPPPGSRDDVRYLSDVMRALTTTACADPHRMYISGFSGGARMASTMACLDADQIAAIAPVSGLRAGSPDRAGIPGPDACRPSKPVGVFAVQGTGDRTNPYLGGGQNYWRYGVPFALAEWARFDKCGRTSPDKPMSKTSTLISHIGCAGDGFVQMLRITGGAHQWPLRNAKVNPGVDVNDMIWAALSRYRR